jgi:putative glutamine amidotransferase
VSTPPFVIVTATTEVLRDRARVRVNEAYTRALVDAGLVPLVLPPVDASIAVATLDGVGGLVLTGGEDVDPAHFGQRAHAATGAPHTERDAYELALARAAFERRVPTLAICRGAQVMNVALGGTLVQDIPSQQPSDVEHDLSNRRTERVHTTDIDANSLLARVVGDTHITVNSSHHQSVDRVADDLRVTARSDDGIIEALEPKDTSWWMLAVQWHPEELTATPEAWDRRLFDAFAAAVRSSGRD